MIGSRRCALRGRRLPAFCRRRRRRRRRLPACRLLRRPCARPPAAVLQVISRLLPIVISKLGPGASPGVQKKVGAGARSRVHCLHHGSSATAAAWDTLHKALCGPACARPRRPQVLEILSHANKRTRALPQLQLPLRDLAALYAGAWLAA